MPEILVVDDEKDLADMIGDVLKLEGYRVELAFNGRKAIEKAKTTHYDLILMDIRLPDLNGVEVLSAIKRVDPEAKIIMMTGFSVDDSIEKALNLGAYTCIYKPLDIERVVSLIEKAIGKAQRPAILLIDDDPSTR